MERLYKCMKSKKTNHSRAREAIFQVLLDNTECLSIPVIIDKLSSSYPKKISINTVYRHLNLFVECDIAVVIQDDFKRAYFCLKEKSLMLFKLCTTCNRVEKIKPKESLNCEEFKDTEFATLHKKCKRCKKNKSEKRE